jgi:DNA polymerase I-like protein with 3'-5' exonuclease and polymerase domains
MSCSNPNLQQLSYEFRKCIKPEAGNKFVGCDYSQVELRAIASLADDRKMINAFKDGKDLHLTTAQLIYGKEKISNEERQIAKTCNFGLIYGMGADGLKRRLKQMVGMDIKLNEARRLRTKFLSSYKGLRRWQEKLLQKNYIKTLGGKRWSTKRLNTQELFNYPVQGSAAEGLKETMIVMEANLPENWKLVAIIHDEILLEVPEAEAESALRGLKKWMVEGMGQIVRDVPIKVDGVIADYWKKS